ASMQARRMLLAAIVFPTALAWLRVRGEEMGLYDSRFGVSLMLLMTIVSLAAVIIAAAIAGRQLEREREAAQNERDRFFDLSLDMLATAGADGFFIRLNPAWQATLGYSSAELTAKPFLEFVHPDDRDATLYEVQRQFAEGKTVLHFQNRYRHRDGTYRWLEWTSQPAPDGSVVYAVARDISVRKLEEERITKRAASLTVRNERLADRAVRDPLTGLYNRAYLEAAVARFEGRRRRGGESASMAAIMFDLDHFGQFNKQHGHQAGDAVLRHFAKLLRDRFRGGDVLARFGGEEFVVLLDGATRDTAVQAAEQIRAGLESAQIDLDGVELHATVSAGCAELDKGMDVTDLLTVADVGLSQAKRAGRNMVVAA
ncbi:MAG: sensor domain-containing diguanylate cyclase, partial [Candidatus Limnocylindria bacterium]